MKIQFIAILALVLLIVVPASALEITVIDKSPTFIEWTWPAGTNVSTLSIDGWTVFAFDHSSNVFLLSNILPNETHTILIVTATGDIGNNTATTDPQQSNSETLAGIINDWIYFIIILIFVIAGMMRRLGIFLVGAICVSLYALYVLLTTGTPGSINPLVNIQFYGYIFMSLFPMYLIYRKGGITR